MTNLVNGINIKADFYLLKGIVENLLKYLGFKNRISYELLQIKELHPGVSASIFIDKTEIGIIGRIHPGTIKDNVIVAEISMTKLYNFITKPLKFKATNKYPEIKKDVAFIVDNSITNKEIIDVIKRAGGRLLTDVDIFDIYNKKCEPTKNIFKYALRA